MRAFDGFRKLLKIRQERKPPRAGFKPKLGAKVVLEDVRMVVQAGLSDELWNWLQQVGFREVTYSPDRRHYRDLPPTLVTRLYDAPPEEWKPLLQVGIQKASKRPPINVGTRSVRVSG